MPPRKTKTAKAFNKALVAVPVPEDRYKLDPPEKKGRIIAAGIQVTRHYCGPLPKPEDFERYDKALPGAAERILKMAEGQAAHRQSMEISTQRNDSSSEKRGSILGFILTILLVLTISFCAYIKQPIPASAIGIGSLGSLLTIYLKSLKSIKEDKPRTEEPSEKKPSK